MENLEMLALVMIFPALGRMEAEEIERLEKWQEEE